MAYTDRMNPRTLARKILKDMLKWNKDNALTVIVPSEACSCAVDRLFDRIMCNARDIGGVCSDFMQVATKQDLYMYILEQEYLPALYGVVENYWGAIYDRFDAPNIFENYVAHPAGSDYEVEAIIAPWYLKLVVDIVREDFTAFTLFSYWLARRRDIELGRKLYQDVVQELFPLAMGLQDLEKTLVPAGEDDSFLSRVLKKYTKKVGGLSALCVNAVARAQLRGTSDNLHTLV